MWSRRNSPSRALERLGLLAALVALVVSYARDAHSQRPPSILVVDEGSGGLARKVRAEAMHIGFAVIEGRASSAGTTDPELLERNGAIALVRISSEDQVEVLVLRPNNQGLYAETIRRRPGEGESFPVRLVEQVRARLVELKVWTPEQPSGSASQRRAASPPPPASKGAPPANAQSPAVEVDRGAVASEQRAAPSRLWLGAGAAGLLPSGGLGPAAYAQLAARFEPDARWGVGLLGLLPVLQGDVSEPEGEAELSATLFAGEIAYSPQLADHWLVAGGVGVGLLVLAMQGEARTPYVASDDRLTAGVYYVHASAGRELTEWLRLRAGIMAGLSAPRPVLRFDDREVASWGRAFAGLSLQAEAGFPLAAGGEVQ